MAAGLPPCVKGREMGEVDEAVKAMTEAIGGGFDKAKETLDAFSDTLVGIIEVAERAKERDDGQTVGEIRAVVEEGLQRIKKLGEQ